MFDFFCLNYKKAAMTFLNQHQVGQRLFSYGDGGRKMRYLRERGYVVSDRVSENRWVHKIVKKP
ncbi:MULTISPECIES: hypothetical protein [unclassified Pseudodesulfovibrio]|uniref:hypothetical protein n=1 Tax=unclassified Pseudodesulfovibrio TaxID=2661612 RepID=UPI000FEBC305|nr:MULTISPECIES: hypothetical protein [unclassified Pseudodesulfovibrio]MCJ2164794.1 hypothetical protein [Pseudodesulfovibrio sp. S3-i]RWU03834.1 hypothetical protein DWB63_10285 [Pseudodesulfovibrio sp. S3]